MQKYNLNRHVEWSKKHDKDSFMNAFNGSVGAEVAKCDIKHKLTTRAHKFDDGETGEVADKLIIEIDFSKATIQPHNDFESDFCESAAETIAQNVNGLFENADH